MYLQVVSHFKSSILINKMNTCLYIVLAGQFFPQFSPICAFRVLFDGGKIDNT